jgi:hypothetical protein
MHRLDPNLPLDELEEVDIALNSANVEKEAEIEQILAEDNSPYPEVRFQFRGGCAAEVKDGVRVLTVYFGQRCEPRYGISTSTCR